ncbi:hypothetical protein ACFQE5_03720 [Pseudonocardia hispaniensis]|uniref:ABC-2 family transporter n=1 Tax=Pseudonocardia hispaniensis TaxID=904933 RepID=A0ABW1IY11_9PSEU
MIWLVWRRQRAALLVGLALVVGAAVVLVSGRLLFVADAQALGLEHCLRPEPRCAEPAWWTLVEGYRWYLGLVHLGLIAVPLLLGMLAGAGLFGRELDRGTHVFALTQAVGRVRWWAVGLLAAGLPAVAAVAALTAVAAWALDPFARLRSPTPLSPPAFEIAGLAPIGYLLLAFIVAASAGLLLRGIPAALVVALVVQVGVLIGLSRSARAHYLPPEVARISIEAGAAAYSLPDGAWPMELRFLDARGETVPPASAYRFCMADTAQETCLSRGGVATVEQEFQPASRFWPFQLIEVAILVVLSAGALALGLVGLRRRAQ